MTSTVILKFKMVLQIPLSSPGNCQESEDIHTVNFYSCKVMVEKLPNLESKFTVTVEGSA